MLPQSELESMELSSLVELLLPNKVCGEGFFGVELLREELEIGMDLQGETGVL